MCDLAIENRDVYYRHKKMVWVGLWGPDTFYDGFKTSWITQSMTFFLKKTSRGVICDAQYMTKFEIVIDTVL